MPAANGSAGNGVENRPVSRMSRITVPLILRIAMKGLFLPS